MEKMIVGIILFTVLLFIALAIGTWIFYTPPPKKNSLEYIFESLFWARLKKLEKEEKKYGEDYLGKW